MESPGEIDIHGRARRRQRIEEILRESDICKENQKLILEYVEYRTVESSISLLRQEKIISSLRTFAGFLGKDFRKATKNDIERIVKDVYNMEPSYMLKQISLKKKGKVDRIEYTSDPKSKRRLSDSTKNAYVKVLKKFFIWLKNEKHPEETDWLKPPEYKPKKLTTEDKLFWEDIEKLSKAATNNRDALLPQILFDSGARIEEILTLRLKDVEIITLNGNGKPKEQTKKCAKLHMRVSKTETRSPIIYKSVPALIEWIDEHPLRNHGESPLFVNLTVNHNPLSYKEARKILLKLKERARIKKRVNPHTFRKSACSHCGDIGMGDAQIDKRFGWQVGSKVKRSYLFPEEQQSNDAYLRGEGIRSDEEEEKRKEPEPVVCLFCEKVNPLGKDFCINPKCRMPLNPEKDSLKDKNELRNLVLDIIQQEFKGGVKI